MAVLRKRNKLVSFRLSEQEYEALQNISVSEGARSISDFARAALCEVLVSGKTTSAVARLEGDNTVHQVLERLTLTMGELNQVMNRLSTLVESNSQNTSVQRD
jgi:hypothetical protein